MLTQYCLFALAAALLALTPGPNTALTISRTADGWRAGLLGVELGFLVHLFAAALGFTAVLLAVPAAYNRPADRWCPLPVLDRGRHGLRPNTPCRRRPAPG